MHMSWDAPGARTIKATAHGPSVMADGPINSAVHKVSVIAPVHLDRCLSRIERPRNSLQEVTGLGLVLIILCRTAS